PHPLSKIFPPMSDDDFNELVTDIKTNGLQQPIVCYQGKILDGAATQYPQLPASPPWASDLLPPEPPLAFSGEEMEPVGTVDEIEASLATQQQRPLSLSPEGDATTTEKLGTQVDASP